MTPPGPGDRARTLAYQRDFWPGLVGYALVLPALLVVRAVARHLRRIDGYQRGLLLAFRLARLFGHPIEQLFHRTRTAAQRPCPEPPGRGCTALHTSGGALDLRPWRGSQ